MVGVVMHRWRRIKMGQRLELEIVIRANHVRMTHDSAAGMRVTSGMCARVCACVLCHTVH